MTAWRGTAALLLLIVALAAGGTLLTRPQAHFADPEDRAAAARGAALYAAHCAQCHGAQLEGEAGWKLAASGGPVRPPPLEASGHSWMHSDDELFRFVKYSMTDGALAGYVSPMPAFGKTLSDADILAVVAFIKSQWPVGVRVYQALLNRDAAGLPAAAATGDWTLPADCRFETNRKPRKPKDAPS